jgi:hypothetical protein
LRQDTYTPAELVAWIDRLAERTWEEVFVFFKHEGSEGPQFARAMLEITSSTVDAPE